LKIEVSPTAERHVSMIDAWWQSNRPSAPDLFVEELAVAFDALLSVPLSGRMVRVRGLRGVRRLLLRATRTHVYYQVRKDSVTVLAVWSAVRGSGPSARELRGGKA
jgi:plasmid stabilization system protein ParE